MRGRCRKCRLLPTVMRFAHHLAMTTFPSPQWQRTRGPTAMKGVISKLVTGGDPRRKSRLHTEQNELIPLIQALIDAPGCLVAKLTKRREHRPPRPWWPVSVIPQVERFLQPSHVVVEFGSGSSTLWLASRAQSVISMEASTEWAVITERRLMERGLSNTRLIRADGPRYWSPPADTGPFDLAIIDGAFRWKCFEAVLPRMNHGGLIYLDNADSDKDLEQYDDDGPRRRVQLLMEREHKVRRGSRLVKARSLIDGELFAGEGWLFYLPD